MWVILQTLFLLSRSKSSNSCFQIKTSGKLQDQVKCHIYGICLYLTENPKLEKQDTFVEKLVTQVIKNLQVKISNIHVRYEDDVSIQADLPY